MNLDPNSAADLARCWCVRTVVADLPSLTNPRDLEAFLELPPEEFDEGGLVGHLTAMVMNAMRKPAAVHQFNMFDIKRIDARLWATQMKNALEKLWLGE